MKGLQLLLALFFGLWIANCTLSHSVGKEFLHTARAVQIHRDDPEAVDVEEEQLGRGGALVLTNLPLFVGLGFIVRSSDPTTGPLYWLLVIAGSVYIPLFLTACAFFLFHAPTSPQGFPGVEWNDGSLEEEDDDD